MKHVVPAQPLGAPATDPFDRSAADAVRPAGELAAPLLSLIGIPFWERVSAATAALAAEGRPLAVLGGDHGCMFPALRGAIDSRRGSVALVSLDAHYDVRPSHHGQPASGVPFRWALEQLRAAGRLDADRDRRLGELVPGRGLSRAARRGDSPRDRCTTTGSTAC